MKITASFSPCSPGIKTLEESPSSDTAQTTQTKQLFHGQLPATMGHQAETLCMRAAEPQSACLVAQVLIVINTRGKTQHKASLFTALEITGRYSLTGKKKKKEKSLASAYLIPTSYGKLP